MSRALVFGRPRAVGVDVACDDPWVSARHLRITQETDGTFTAEDLGSSNGTFVAYPAPFGPGLGSWVILRNPTPLLPGMRIRIGQSVLPWAVDR